jgi:hypothetical protein
LTEPLIDPGDSGRDAARSLTAAQRRIVEWGDGPAVVIAGAGTGKTRVIVERVRWLLETKGSAAVAVSGDLVPSEAREPDPGNEPFAGQVLPEQILVLTYNVKAAKELSNRIEESVGPAARARLSVSNFHSFCHRILTESAADAGLPARPDVLDGIGQVLLLRDLRPTLPLLYYAGGSNPNYWLDQLVAFINRAKDELVTPDDFDVFVSGEREAFERRYGSYERALERVQAQGNLAAVREVRKAYADFRRGERAEEAGDANANPDLTEVEKTADREARRTISGDARATSRSGFASSELPRIDALADTYVTDGAALEVLRRDRVRRVLGVHHRQEVPILGIEQEEEPEEHNEGRPIEFDLIWAGVDATPRRCIDTADELVDDVLVQALGESLAEADRISAGSCSDSLEAPIWLQSVRGRQGAKKGRPSRRQQAGVELYVSG